MGKGVHGFVVSRVPRPVDPRIRLVGWTLASVLAFAPRLAFAGDGWTAFDMAGKTFLPIGATYNIGITQPRGDVGVEVSYHRWSKDYTSANQLGLGVYGQLGAGGIPFSEDQPQKGHLRLALGGQVGWALFGLMAGASYRSGQNMGATAGIYISVLGVANVGYQVELPLLYHRDAERDGPISYFVIQGKYPWLIGTR